MAPNLTQNKALIYKSVPHGYPVPGKDLATETRSIDLAASVPSGSILVRNHYASYDPYMRGKLRAPEGKSYSPPYTLGEPLATFTVSKVLKVAAGESGFKEGDLVTGVLPLEEYSIVPTTSIQHLENPLDLDLKLFIGALGMPGHTAYASLYEIGKPQKGETIFVSAASGAVGQIVGQLAKREGLRVIGSVGSDAKLKFIKEELGFDDGFNYKTEKPADALKRLTAASGEGAGAGGGVDIYYDNVGGEQLEAALGVMNTWGRLSMCSLSFMC
jgi:NADPH-dependent curcumin reductase CurA